MLRNKKLLSIITVIAVVFTCVAIGFAATGNGNGAPSGSHYNLNIIGVDKNKTATMDNSNGHVIFVPTYGKTRIELTAGDSFRVLDANGTDEPIEEFTSANGVTYSADGTATFQMPADVTASYYVFVRVLGTPKNEPSAVMTPGYYFTDTYGTWLYMSEVNVPLSRTAGKQKFADVSKALLNVVADVNGDGTSETIPLFSDANKSGSTEDDFYFWDYDNKGLKLAQLRFYPVN